jgi:uncharacterized protein YcbK (DUF882 family)
VPVGTARPNSSRFCASRAGYSCGLALLVVLFGCRGLQNAVADGDTRTITLHHIHTDENITITYKRDGRYDEAALEKLNWFLRDWRRGKQTRMDPQLIDLLWEVQRETGSKQPIDVVCGYRSPETNALLRRRSSGVARYSQHILGHAVDFYIPGVPLEELRVIGLRLQRGGVGFYPTSGSPFVHMDTGGVRMWPRMTRDQLLHVFPDGRTVYLPSDGHPLPGYAVALAELKKRGQNPTETWFDEARAQGLKQNVILASDEHPAADPYGQFYAMTRADREADAREAAPTPPATSAPRASAAQTPAMNALLAALEREAARLREARLATSSVPTSAAALYQTASYTPPLGGEAPQQVAALAPSQIIMARGSRDGLLDRETTAPAANPPAMAAQDRVPPQLALAYAEQPEHEAQPTVPAALAKPAAIAQAQPPQPPAATTIAVKRDPNQPISTVVAARPRVASAAAQGAQFDNPWLGAVMISPSVRQYLTVLTLGAQDYRALASLVEKPASSVMMAFGANPNPGLTDDRFSGSAVVFVSTVTYGTHTAALR